MSIGLEHALNGGGVAGPAFASGAIGRARSRWVFSALTVLLAHTAILGGIVTWRAAIDRTHPPGPIIIELTPPPARPEQVRPQAAPDIRSDKVEQKPVEQGVGQQRSQGGNTEQAPQVTAPAVTEPPNSTAAPGGGAPPAPHPAPTFSAPLDLRIAEPPRLRFKRSGPMSNNALKNGLGAPASGAGLGLAKRPAPPLKSFARPSAPIRQIPGGGAERNALGIPTQGPTGIAVGKPPGAAPTRQPSSPVATARNALGAPVSGPARTGGLPGSGNPLAGSPAGSSAAEATHPGPGIKGNHPNAAATVGTTSQTGINGTRMIRPGAGAAAIGGPAKSAGGVLNGTRVRTK